MNKDELERYSRHILLPEIGIEGQQKLKSAKVLVIGAGGLGCPALLYLAASGVGEIGIIDGDVVDKSNLQRQVLYTTEDVGRYKAEVAKEKLARQNPHICLTAFPERLTSENALRIIGAYGLVVDGSDNFSTRYLVNDACVILNKPLVYGAVFKFEGQVSVFNYQGGPTYRCLFPSPGEMPDCSTIGVMPVLPGIVGLLQAGEAIKIITGTGVPLSGKLLRFDALSMNFETFGFAANDKNRKIKKLTNCGQASGIAVKEITPAELKMKKEQGEKFQLIDVREESEYQVGNIGGELIPLKQLPCNLHKISPVLPVIIHCQSGMRSKQAAKFLMERGFENVYSVKGMPI